MSTGFKQRVIARFDRAAKSYDAHASVQKRAARQLASFLPPPPEVRRILEIGCGTGFFTRYLIAAYPEAELFSTDISASMLAVCKESCHGRRPSRHFAVMDGEAPDIEGPFDLIASNMTFQWFEDFEGSLTRLKRLLSARGRLLFSTLGPQSYLEWKKTLEKLGLPDGTLRGQPVAKPLAEEVFRVHHDHPMDFLKNLKRIGATASRQAVRLTPSQLRMALRQCGNEMTYHLVYAAIFNR